jgi:UDP-glucose 4-epimerase
VIHLAAVTDAAGSFSIRERVERVNVGGTERVALACALTGAPLIFPSTTSVYGPHGAVVDEACPASDLKPQSPYAASKLAGESLLSGRKGLRFCAFRFGTIFGTSPGMRFHTAVNKFAWQACMGEPLTVWKYALGQKRPYLDLEDAVRAIVHVLKTGLFDRRVYNAATLNATVGEIVGELRRLVPDLAVTEVSEPIMNQLSYSVDSARLKAAGFSFSGDLSRGLAETVELLRRSGGR